MPVAIGLGENEVARWNVDRAKTARQAACPGTRCIDVTGTDTISELHYRICAISRVAPKAKENIVVAVEYQLHFKSWASSIEQIGNHNIKMLRRFAIPKMKKFAYE
jgi:hypothetical protein